MLAVSSFYISSVGILPSLEVVGRVDKVNWSSLIQPNCLRHLYGWMEKIFWGARREFLLFIIIMSKIPLKKESLDVRISRERQTFNIRFAPWLALDLLWKNILISVAEQCSWSWQAECVEFHWFSDPDDCQQQQDRSGQNLIKSILSHLCWASRLRLWTTFKEGFLLHKNLWSNLVL